VKLPLDLRAAAARSMILLITVAASFLTFWAENHAVSMSLPASVRHRWLIFAILAIAVAAGLPLIRQWRAERTVTRAMVTINDALGPIACQSARLASLSDPSERAGVKDQLLTMILNSVGEVLTIGRPTKRIRVCWYSYDAVAEKLEPGPHVGRSSAPITVFSSGSTEGMAVLERLKTKKPIVCGNVRKSPPVGWSEDQHGDYKSLMAMPVIAGQVPLGMLFLDAPRVGALTVQDVPIVKLFADSLAGALVLGAKSGV
jgi:GAF domain-containing protein